MEELLKKVQHSILSVEEAMDELATYDNLGFAKVDLHREKRKGFPETIYGEGKTTKQINAIIQSIIENKNDVLVTRISKEKSTEILNQFPQLKYNEQAQLLYTEPQNSPTLAGYIAVICAGTSDIYVAEEAAITAELYGAKVHRYYDVGVAGIHRLLN